MAQKGCSGQRPKVPKDHGFGQQNWDLKEPEGKGRLALGALSPETGTAGELGATSILSQSQFQFGLDGGPRGLQATPPHGGEALGGAESHRSGKT